MLISEQTGAVRRSLRPLGVVYARDDAMAYGVTTALQEPGKVPGQAMMIVSMFPDAEPLMAGRSG